MLRADRVLIVYIEQLDREKVEWCARSASDLGSIPCLFCRRRDKYDVDVGVEKKIGGDVPHMNVPKFSRYSSADPSGHIKILGEQLEDLL